MDERIDNYWTTLTKISLFVSVLQINYLPQPSALAIATDKSRYFAITEYNNCFIIRSPSFLNSYLKEFLGSLRVFIVYKTIRSVQLTLAGNLPLKISRSVAKT